MGIILWLVIGGVIGWLASIVMRTDGSQGIVLNVVVGIIGAFLGGWLISPMVGAPSINSGEISIASVLLLVVIADAAQNAMAGGYDTVAEGTVLVLTIVFWNWLLDVLSYRFAVVRRFATPSQLLLVRHGVLQRRNMRREYITLEE